jgi:hypothetical protein
MTEGEIESNGFQSLNGFQIPQTAICQYFTFGFLFKILDSVWPTCIVIQLSTFNLSWKH